MQYELRFHGGQFVVVAKRDGKPPKRIRTGTDDKGAAQRFLEDLRQKADEAGSEKATVAMVYERYLASLREAKKPIAEILPYNWKALEPTFGHLLPGQISEATVKGYIQQRRTAGRKDGTINTELGRLARIIAYGAERGLCKAARRIERPKPSPPRQWYVPREDASRLIEACETPHIRTFVILALTTAARMSAILELTWSRVDFDKGLVSFADGIERGNKRRSTVPMNATLRAELVSAKRFGISEYVVEYGGRKVASVKKAIKAAGVRVGMPWLSAHVLRHSAAMWMVSDNVPIAKVAQYLGDTAAMVEKRYGSYAPGYLSDAAAALEIETPTRLRMVK